MRILLQEIKTEFPRYIVLIVVYLATGRSSTVTESAASYLPYTYKGLA